MQNIKILKNKTEWDNFLSRTDNYDFYHTYDYHQISKHKSDSSILIQYEYNNVLIGIPLLIRGIKNTSFYDAISVYGYSGPIYGGNIHNFDFEHFQSELQLYFESKKIVSVFMRLNPYIKLQNSILEKFGELTNLGKVVNINLSLSPEEQRRKYPKSLKNRVNKAKRLLSLKIAETGDDFQKFKEIYFENMERLNAKELYYFNDDYFQKFKESKDLKTDLLLAIDNETKEVVAGSMFVKTNSIIQYHLSGSKKEFLHLNGVKFIIDQMRLKANEEGYEFLNLGGGLGANENDSLFKFKSDFSDDFKSFYLWKYIVDKKTYNDLCTKKNITEKESSYFPLYRLGE